jgi:hypothetical protein
LSSTAVGAKREPLPAFDHAPTDQLKGELEKEDWLVNLIKYDDKYDDKNVCVRVFMLGLIGPDRCTFFVKA